MNTLTDWIKSELYPGIYDRLDQVLPELQLIRRGRNWYSPLNRDGSQPKHKRKDKTVIHYKAPGHITENGEAGSVGLLDYLIARDNKTLIDTIRHLAAIASLQVPSSKESEEAYQQKRQRANLLEEAQAYYVYCLHSDSKGAEQVREYLQNQRGYSVDQIRTMGLGYLPSQKQLYDYLQKRGHDQATELLKLHPGIGDSHRLTIPYYSGGQLHGHTYRETNQDSTQQARKDKYLNQTGLNKTELLFNLKPERKQKEVILVEGYLDALAAEAMGIENVAALAGTTISREQIAQALSKGIETFTLCLDQDKAGRAATKANIEALLEAGVYTVYTVILPHDPHEKADLDSVLRTQGATAAQQAIDQAQTYYSYLLQDTLERYAQLEQDSETHGLTDKQIAALLEDIVRIGAGIKQPLHRDQYKAQFTQLQAIQDLGITQEAYELTVEQLTTTKAKEEQSHKLRTAIQQADKLNREGNPAQAIELLNKTVPDLAGISREQEYDKLLAPTTLEQDRERMQSLPGDLETGYSVSAANGQQYPILLPGAGLTVIAGATGHGKTTLLINLALDVANRYPDRRVIYLTYEEQEAVIRSYFLNTYIGQQLNNSSSSSRGNKAVIKEYLRTGSTQYTSKADLLQDLAGTFYEGYVETGRIQVKEIEYEARDLVAAIRHLHKSDKTIAGIFLDYFQLLYADSLHKREKGAGTRQEELKQVCIELKNAAKDTGLPLIVGAQFNRQVQSVADVDYTCIGEAGDIERIANTILGIFDIRYEPKNSTKQPKAVADRIGEHEAGLFVEVLKSRYMPRGGRAVYDYNSNTGVISKTSLL